MMFFRQSYLRDGNSYQQDRSINNGIDFAGEGGMTYWIKTRNQGYFWMGSLGYCQEEQVIIAFNSAE